MSFYDKKSFEKDYKKLLKNGGIIKLELSIDERNSVQELVKEYPDLESFEIKSNDNIYLILRYRDIKNKIAYKDIMERADLEFDCKNYKRSLMDYLILLECSIYPKSDLYAKIGLCYYNLNDLVKAEGYLMIANYKNEESKNFELEESAKYFEERVKRIRSERYNTKNLEKVESYKSNFNKFDEIVDYVSACDSDIESVGMEFSLSNDERDFVKLNLAIEFYKQGDIEKGNYYLNAVENSPNKSKKIIKFCEEVRNNKNFYQYREDNQPKKLTFIRTGKRKRVY